MLARSAYQQVGVGHVGGVQMLVQHALVDALWIEATGRDLAGDRPDRVEQLGPTAVVEREGERERRLRAVIASVSWM